MSDPKQPPFDPQQHSQPGGTQNPSTAQNPSAHQGEQQNEDDSDEELSSFLQKEHGHTKQSADQEVKRDREGVKRKKKQHEDQHGKGSR